jgi:peptidyl-dipeptidase A/DNA-directed RNA polymerase III subunit RPC1
VQDEAHAREYLSTLDVKSSDMCYKSNIAEWQYASDITDENQRLKVGL